MMESAMTLMNVLLGHINAHLMPPVTTPLDHTSVYAILASLGMEEVVLVQLDMIKMGESAVILMNALKDHIHAQSMPYVLTQLDPTDVHVLLDLLEMGTLAMTL